jgi:acyl-coenzyme A thioesterase PaaI-like protein
MLAAMLDSATGNAVMAKLPSHLTALTTRLDTQFLRPAALRAIVATARIVHQDDRSVEATAELTDCEGRIVATARAELRVRERKNRS